ncbi:hypothetical protein GW756_01660 [bacterium]|nr:hypothetical protein [bacterium]NCQ55061.1 hypothetical protein [Candidatus Parcubacteria bacterium]NCS67105.1 hypothetical protein [Candidatus Peregrinibacteria bacterium]NCS96051.1 hypothetical protein [bacterium]
MFRVDVVARNIERNGTAVYGGGVVGFSNVGSNIGTHARFIDGDSRSICDVFRTPSTPNIRLFVSAQASATFDKIYLREVIGNASVSNNNDCDISDGIVLGSDD